MLRMLRWSSSTSPVRWSRALVLGVLLLLRPVASRCNLSTHPLWGDDLKSSCHVNGLMQVGKRLRVNVGDVGMSQTQLEPLNPVLFRGTNAWCKPFQPG